MLETLRLKLKGYKTFLINSISIFVAAVIWILPDLINFLGNTDLGPLVPAEYAPLAAMGISLANIYLRKITTTPMFQKE